LRAGEDQRERTCGNKALKKSGINPEPFLLRKAKQSFYNTDHIKENLYSYLQAFSPSVRDIFERFDFYTQIDRLAKSGLLYQVTENFAGIDLHPGTVSNTEMGTVFEELIRKFAEISNETAGEHFTPRKVIRLMVNLIFVEDDEKLAKPGVGRTIYDPTAGTGGMLSVAGEYLGRAQSACPPHHVRAGTQRWALRDLKADMLIKGQDAFRLC
jgi:type I restriction enzyme M protein